MLNESEQNPLGLFFALEWFKMYVTKIPSVMGRDARTFLQRFLNPNLFQNQKKFYQY